MKQISFDLVPRSASVVLATLLAASVAACGGSDSKDHPDSGTANLPDASTADASSPDGGPTGPSGMLESPSTTTAPVLDGELDDVWDAATPVTFQIGDAMQALGVQADYGFDASVQFRSLHTASAIYFVFDVTDDVLIHDSADRADDDAVELYIDAAGDGTGAYGNDDHWLVIDSIGKFSSLGPTHMDIRTAEMDTETGYRLEVAIDRASLNATPVDGGSIGFDVALVDDDGLGGDDVADAYGLWYVKSGNHCPSCCPSEESTLASCDTSVLGQLILGAAE